MSKLAEQIEATSRNLERGHLTHGDNVLLNHILEEFALLVDTMAQTDISDVEVRATAYEFVGSTAELVEDGLED